MRRPTDILFVSYGGGHVKMLESVFEKMTDDGWNTSYMALTTAQQHLAARRIPYFGYADLPAANDPATRLAGEKLLGTEDLSGPVSRAESLAYHGLNFLDLVSDHGERRALELYAEKGRQAFLPVRTMRRLMEDLRPRLVVATTSPRSERAALKAAQLCSIPTACVVGFFANHEEKWISEPGFANRICVLNDAIRDRFLRLGCKPEEVVATGNPAFDRLHDPKLIQAAQKFREEQGWTEETRVILWASNVEPESHPFTGQKGDPTLPRRIEAKLRELVVEDPSLRLVVRYHPSEQVTFEPGVDVYHSTKDEDLTVLLHAVDAVIVMASTVGMEAAIAGRPVLAVECSIFSADSPYSSTGIAVGVPNLEEIGPSLRKMLDDTFSDSGRVRGATASRLARDRVCDVLRDLLGPAI